MAGARSASVNGWMSGWRRRGRLHRVDAEGQALCPCVLTVGLTGEAVPLFLLEVFLCLSGD